MPIGGWRRSLIGQAHQTFSPVLALSPLPSPLCFGHLLGSDLDRSGSGLLGSASAVQRLPRGTALREPAAGGDGVTEKVPQAIVCSTLHLQQRLLLCQRRLRMARLGCAEGAQSAYMAAACRLFFKAACYLGSWHPSWLYTPGCGRGTQREQVLAPTPESCLER